MNEINISNQIPCDIYIYYIHYFSIGIGAL